MHLGDPVPQRVHDQLQHVGVPHQQAVAGARGVVVVRPVTVDQAVVRGVVDAPEGERGALLAALGRVVVDHVEDHFEAGRVQRLHHGLELVDLLAPAAESRIRMVRREEADGVVAPVVGQPPVLQDAVLDELVDRHQLHGGDAERRQVLDDRGVGEPGVGAAQPLGDVRVGAGQTAHVRLVDDGVGVRVPWGAVVAPVEVRVGDHTEHRVPGAVGRGRTVRRTLVEGGVVVDLPVHRSRVGVEQQLRRVAPVSQGRLPGAVHAVAVALPRADGGQMGVPHEPVDLVQRDGPLGAGVVHQDQLDVLGDLAEQREVGALSVEGGTQRVGVPAPDGHPCAGRASRHRAPSRASSAAVAGAARTATGRARGTWSP